MIVVCPSCSARFQYDDARFQGAKTKRFRCPKCGVVFDVMNPALAAQAGTGALVPPVLPPPAPTPAPLPPPPPKATETTARNRPVGQLDPADAGEGMLPPGFRFSLAFLTGPQASTVRLLSTAVTIIGREEGDVIINDPETSRKHARIDIHLDGTAWLSDLDSTNGTYTDGKLIEGPTQLLDRQEFSCGRSTFMLLIRPVDSMSMDG